MNDSNSTQDALLSTALNDLPLQPLPAGMTQRIMQQVRPRVQTVTVAPFRVHVSDVMLALGLTVVLILSLLIATSAVLELDMLPTLSADWLPSFNSVQSITWQQALPPLIIFEILIGLAFSTLFAND